MLSLKVEGLVIPLVEAPINSPQKLTANWTQAHRSSPSISIFSSFLFGILCAMVSVRATANQFYALRAQYTEMWERRTEQSNVDLFVAFMETGWKRVNAKEVWFDSNDFVFPQFHFWILSVACRALVQCMMMSREWVYSNWDCYELIMCILFFSLMTKMQVVVGERWGL